MTIPSAEIRTSRWQLEKIDAQGRVALKRFVFTDKPPNWSQELLLELTQSFPAESDEKLLQRYRQITQDIGNVLPQVLEGEDLTLIPGGEWRDPE